MTYLESVLPDTQLEKDNMSARGFVKFNTELMQVVAKIDFGKCERRRSLFPRKRRSHHRG